MSEPLQVCVDWLNERLNDRLMAIVDCRFALMQPEQGQQQYQTSHIPGAFYLDLNRDLSSPVQQHGGRHPLPNLTELIAKLESIGISSQPPTLVVIYDDSRQAFAARLWWLLHYLGHDRVVVLDGGFAAWQFAGYPVTTEIPVAVPGKFDPKLQPQRLVDIATVKACKDTSRMVLVDSREGERYRGEQEPIDLIAGHIPGAVNYPWQAVTDDRGFLRPVNEQRQHWATLPPSDEIVVYCGSGVTACVNLLSLEIAGIHHAKLYVGSWSDWCSYES